eukprot:5584985-Prymnesium_polylepis.1
MASNPEQQLHQFLATAVGSEQLLFEDLPLMEKLPRSLAVKHYVELRKLLHLWASRSVEMVPSMAAWDWPFVFGDGTLSSSGATVDTASTEDVAARWALWFEDTADLIDAEAAAQVQDVLDGLISTLVARERSNARKASSAIFIQSHIRRRRQRLRTKAELTARQAAEEAALSALGALYDAQGVQALRAAMAAARPHAHALVELQDAMANAEAELREHEQRKLDEAKALQAERRQRYLKRFSCFSAVVVAIFLSLPIMPNVSHSGSVTVSQGGAVLSLEAQAQTSSHEVTSVQVDQSADLAPVLAGIKQTA